MVATFVSVAVNAMTTTCLLRTSDPLTSNRVFKPDTSEYLQGFYEIAKGSHQTRALTFFDAGSLEGISYATVTYISNGSMITEKGENSERKTGWMYSGWQTVSTWAQVVQITYTGDKYNNRKELFSREYLSISRSGS